MPHATKILLVEDHHDIRRVMAMLLGHAGFHVVQASNVAQAIALVDGQSVALLDLYLPDGFGTEVLQHIRKQAHRTRIAIITAAYDFDFVQAMLNPGDAIFKKPIAFAQLLEWINLPVPV